MSLIPAVVQRAVALVAATSLLPLLVATSAHAAGTEIEPNDDPSTATPIGVGLDRALSAGILGPHDRDHFAVDIDAPGSYVIQVFDVSASLGPTHVTVLGDLHQYGFTGGNHTVGAQGGLTAHQAGTYVFIVDRATTTQWPMDRTGTYRVRVLPAHDQPGAAWDAQGEPDGMLQLSRDIPIGSWVPGEIQAVPPGTFESARDEDYLTFAAEPEVAYTIRVRAPKAKEVTIHRPDRVWDQTWRAAEGSGWVKGVPGVKHWVRVAGGDLGGYEICIERRGETCSSGVARIAGRDRYDTAARVSATFPTEPSVVFVAAGTKFPDALAGSALAARWGGPVLLLPERGIPVTVANEIQRLKPRKIVVLGSEGTISAQTFDELATLLPLVYSDSMIRIAGDDRFETAAKVSAQFPYGVDVAYVTTGLDFPDALSGAALAGVTGGPILLTRRDALSPATAQELWRLAPKRIVILGGEDKVSEQLAQELRTYARADTDDEVTRLAGSNRYETSALIAARFPGSAPEAYVATGARFPDALSGAARAAWAGGPMVLVPGPSVPASIGTQLRRLSPEAIRVLGGPDAVSDTVQVDLAQYLR
jgi:putative cell wall-binding protein